MKLAVVAVLLIAAAGSVAAQTLRWSNQGNYVSADPHSTNTVITQQINAQVYDRLLMRGRKLEIVPALAMSWQRTSPNTWVFNLRKDVKWHDGSEFTAADVVFSIRRAQGPTSGFRTFGAMMGTAREIDRHTVEFTTEQPNPVLLDAAAIISIMSKAWCERHRVEKAQDFSRKEETYAARNAMGTGAFTLASHEPEVRSVFRKNPGWWGLKEGLFEGNVKEVVFVPIASDATRLAALASGNIDFILDPPSQDIERIRGDRQFRVYEGTETTVFFLGMDQQREELLYSSVKGRNPFKDVRVRRAVGLSIDMNLIVRTALRGLGVPTGVAMPNPEGAGIPDVMRKRDAADVGRARQLLAEAGYASGFTVTMDCDVRTERVCTAIAGMLARVGITLNLAVAPAAQFYQKVRKLDSSFHLIGWVSAIDSIFTLQPLMHSRNDKGDGEWNLGNFRDDRLDAVIDQLKVEFDEAKRRALTLEAVRILRENVYVVPLYRRMAPWVSRKEVEVHYRPDTWLETRWVRVR